MRMNTSSLSDSDILTNYRSVALHPPLPHRPLPMDRAHDRKQIGIEIEIAVSVGPHDSAARIGSEAISPGGGDGGVGVEARVGAEVVGRVLLVGGAGGEDVGGAADGAGGAEEVGAVGHGAGEAD